MHVKKYLFIISIISFHWVHAQENNIQPDSWKWLIPSQELKIKLGKDTLTTPPISNVATKEWWKAFGYQELNILTKLALEENNHIKIGETGVEASKARVKYAKSFLYPSVSFNPSLMRQEYSANRPLPFDVAAQRITNTTYTLPLDLSYEVDITGKINNQAKASSYEWQASQASQNALELSVTAEVARNFTRLLTLDAEKGILERTIQSRQENLEIVETRYKAGLVNEIDYQRAKTELSSVMVQLKNNQLQRNDIELTLSNLCGQPPSTFSIESTNLKYLAPNITYLLPPASEITRPDIQADEYRVASYQNVLKSAKKDLYPSLYFNGSLGLLSGETEDIFDSKSRNWLIGATLSVPVFEGGRRRAQLSINEHQLQGSENRLEQKKLMANQEVEQALSNLSQINEQLTIQQEFLSAAQKAAELSSQRYRKGLVTYLEVVDAERIVLEAERLQAQLVGQQLINTINLFEATGGELQ